jgi:hypothetical protein
MAAGCKHSWLDHSNLDVLPPRMRCLLPTSRSLGSKAKTGVDAVFADVMASMVAGGASFNLSSKAFNTARSTQHAQREEGFYDMLSKAHERGELKRGQVRRGAECAAVGLDGHTVQSAGCGRIAAEAMLEAMLGPSPGCCSFPCPSSGAVPARLTRPGERHRQRQLGH